MARAPARQEACDKKHMDAATQALCFFYRNPPPESGVKPQPYKAIPKLIHQPQMSLGRVKMAVKRFLKKKRPRGRKPGWRKTTPAEDKAMLDAFHKVRQPLGSLVEARDVWKALRPTLRNKVSVRTVANRLRDKGYKMEEKLAGDDKGEQWRKARVRFCECHKSKSAVQWATGLQAVADFRYFVYYPQALKNRHARKSAPRTIMRKSEKMKAAFMKPKRSIFKRSEYKRVQKAKVFGLTTSSGQQLICHVPARLDAKGWIKVLHKRVGPFMKEAFPNRKTCTILLDGETLLHTDDAKAAMREEGLRALRGWPAHSPDLNPQENVWAWAEPRLRKEEAKADSFAKFKQRVLKVCRKYPSGEKLVPSLAHRIALCARNAGAPIGK